MTVIDQSALSVRSAAELLAAVPYVLGFHPADSVVVVALRGTRVVFMLRGDLPDPLAPPSPETGPAAIAAQLAAVVKRQEVDRAMIVGYGSPARTGPMIEALTAELDRSELPVLETLQVTGNRYRSYGCADPDCCPPEGTPFDTSTSRFAAAATFAGQVALPDRDTLARQVAPVEGPARQAMREATRRAEARLHYLLNGAATGLAKQRVLRRAGRSAIRLAMRRHRTGGRLTDDEVAWLSRLLAYLPTRDDAWQWTTGEEWQVALWTDVLRRAEPELVAAPASLLAFAAWLAGHGALASVALDRALEAQPTYTMALLLAEALQAGVPPSALRNWPEIVRSVRRDPDSR